LLSRLPFGSFLSYSPHGTSPEERRSVAVGHRIKQDGYVRLAGGEVVRIIRHTVARLRTCLTPELADLLAADVVLVPTPGSAPLPPRQPQALWAARRVCEELLAAGFGARMEPLLSRLDAVPKSAFAARENRSRPDLRQHYASLAARLPAGASPARITLVDDFITKGATLLAAASRLAEVCAGAEIRAFALVRTQYPVGHQRGKQIFRAIVDPVYSRVTLGRHGAWRRDP
jgi:hypothetical protein